MSKIFDLINEETKRQNEGLELIASENYVSKDILKAMGSILTNKYAEGYPDKRYYGGCKYIDQVEQYAIDKACELFKCKFANVQPHSGSQANAEAYRALEKYLDKKDDRFHVYTEEQTGETTFRKMKILAMQLNDGGHLTHGSSVSFSSNLYDFSFFPLDETGRINFELVEKAIKKNKPDVILAGCSAYPYEIDFSKFRELADKYKCMFMVDMAHIAGLVAADEHMSPIPYADIVTATTHKTLRGPRGGLILTNNEELYKLVNSAVFPYYQGGPLEHIIAAKAICFEEALKPEFKEYIKLVKTNTKAFSDYLRQLGVKCSETENHLTLIDVKSSFGLTGLEAQEKLEEINITTNKNMIPNDTEKPNKTSGLRIGFAALTTRNLLPRDAMIIARVIYDYLKCDLDKERALATVSYIRSHLKNIDN